MTRFAALFGLSLFFSGTCWAQCSGVSKANSRLGWSEPANILAPDRSWVVEVKPVFGADDNRTPVTIRKCGEAVSKPLFILQRDAQLYWSSDSKHLVVVNQPWSGTNKLLFFSVPSETATNRQLPADSLDKTVSETLIKYLGDNKRIQFYLPAFVSWKDTILLLAIGGTSNIQRDGSVDTYCFGMLINSNTLRVEKVLSEKELKISSGRSCQLSP